MCARRKVSRRKCARFVSTPSTDVLDAENVSNAHISRRWIAGGSVETVPRFGCGPRGRLRSGRAGVGVSENSLVPFPPVRVLCCEGACSGAYHHRTPRVFRRGLGYTPRQARGVESSFLRHTSHAESRRETPLGYDEVRIYYRCLVCGHERMYGTEWLTEPPWLQLHLGFAHSPAHEPVPSPTADTTNIPQP